MKRYNLLIQDKDESGWNLFVENKNERNLDEAIINLIKEFNKKQIEVINEIKEEIEE